MDTCTNETFEGAFFPIKAKQLTGVIKKKTTIIYFQETASFQVFLSVTAVLRC